MLFIKLIFLLVSVNSCAGLLLPYGLQNGDSTFGHGDDKCFTANTTKPIKLEDELFNEFYVSSNGAIFTYKYNQIDPSRDFQKFPNHSLLVYFSDSKVDDSCAKDSCSIFSRTNVSNSDINAIENLVKKYDYSFTVDANRTLVVTWFNVQAFYEDSENTFQAVITSDGFKTFSILSYEKLEYYKNPSPKKRFAKVGFKGKYGNACDFQGKNSDPTKLTCRSNVNIPGVFLVALANGTHAAQCRPGEFVDYLSYSCSHCPGEETWLHMKCPSAIEQVCSGDGKTYDNLCEFHKQACRWNDTLSIHHSGKCNESLLLTTPVTTNSITMFNCDFETGVCGFSLGQWLRDCCGTGSTGTGPSVDASGSSYGWYIYKEATGGTYGDKARSSVTVQNPNRLVSGCLHFAYHMYGASMGTLNVYYGQFWEELKIFSISGNQGDVWHRQVVMLHDSSILGLSYFMITFESIRGDGYKSDIALDEISLTMGGNCSGSIPVPTVSGFDCDFESDLCGLFLGTWLRDCCGTPSSGTGPSDDGSGSTYGYYIYREATGESTGSKASFSLTLQNPQSQVLDWCLRFKYHMYGSDMGTLNVYYGVRYSTKMKIVSISGNQGNMWHQKTVALTDSSILGQSSFQVIFESVRGSGFESDIALDEISIKLEKSCTDTLLLTELYPYGSAIDSIASTGYRRTTTVYLPKKIPLFSFQRDQLYISTSGIISVNTRLSSVYQIPSSDTFISLFNDDLDTTYSGNIFYRFTTDQNILMKADQDIQRLNNSSAFNTSSAVVITYSNVTKRWSSSSLRHNFQLVLATNGNTTFAIMNYAQLNSIPGVVGYSETRCNYQSFSKYTLISSSNVGVRGRHVYQLTNYDCFKPLNELYSVLYPSGSSIDSIASTGYQRTTTVYLPQKMPLFSLQKDRLYISTSGVISVNSRLYSVYKIPTSDTFVSLFDGLDTTYSGDIFYRFTTDQSILLKADQDIQRLSNNTFKTSIAVIITYANVPKRWSSSSLRHTFQLVLTTDGNTTFVIMNYARLDSKSNVIGYSETACNYRDLSNNTLVSSSNVGVRGRHVYQLTKYDCFKPLTGLSTVQYSFYAYPGISTRYTYYALIDKERKEEIDIATAELVGESANPHAVFIKAAGPTRQQYSVFSANLLSERKILQTTIVYKGTPKNTSFQYGQVNVSDVSPVPRCQYVPFSIKMLGMPSVKLTGQIGLTSFDILHHAHVWLYNVSQGGFGACYKEAYEFSGYRSISLNYIAVVSSRQDKTKQIKEHGIIRFPQNRTQLCRRVPLRLHYIKNFVSITPIMISERSHHSFMAWLVNSTTTEFTICAKSSSDTLVSFKSDMKVNYFVEGTLSPCNELKCPSHLECLLSFEKPYCGCKRTCFFEASDEGFCGTDFKFYKNQCDLDRQHCLSNGSSTKTNVKVAYAGKCQQLPYQKGVTQLDVLPGQLTIYCKYIKLEYDWRPFGKIYVQLSESWGGRRNSLAVNQTAVWSENISTKGFKACVKSSGQTATRPFVHWMTYQDGFVDGIRHSFIMNLPTWYSREKCFFYSAFSVFAPVLVTIELTTSTLQALSLRHETYGRICLSEIHHHDGPFNGVRIHVLVMNSIRKPFISEVGAITLKNKDYNNGLLCETVEYNSGFPSLPNPTVLITGESRYSGSVWIEETTNTHLSVCYKHHSTYYYTSDVVIRYFVFPELCGSGWVYAAGRCYKPQDNCTSYGLSKQHCNALNASLPVVMSEAQQFFLGQVEQTSKAWIGLTDVITENVWEWEAGYNSTFQKWLPGRPNGGRSENCAVITKDGSSVGWDDMPCSTCASFQCEKDADLVNRSCDHFCQNGGVCSYTASPDNITISCSCPNGIYGRRCEINVTALEECNNYTLHNEEWRRIGSTSSFVLQSNTTSCDAKYLKQGWHRFGGGAGTQLHHTTCVPSGTQCGTHSPGWLNGTTPSVADGIVTRMLRYRTFYCADDTGEVQIRNCGSFFTYKFIRLPYWSCQYGVCTVT